MAKVKYNWDEEEIVAGLRYVTKQYAPHDTNGISKYHGMIGYHVGGSSSKYLLINLEDGMTGNKMTKKAICEHFNRESSETVPKAIFDALLMNSRC